MCQFSSAKCVGWLRAERAAAALDAAELTVCVHLAASATASRRKTSHLSTLQHHFVQAIAGVLRGRHFAPDQISYFWVGVVWVGVVWVVLMQEKEGVCLFECAEKMC